MDYFKPTLEKTEVIYGEENTTKITLQFAQNAKARIDCCLDSTAVTVAAGVPEFRDAIMAAIKRGIKLRYITEVTSNNLIYCTEFVKLVELRHLDGIKGNFAVNENESISTAIIMQEAKPIPKAIYSNIREVVLQQQYFFETLWNKAIPAEQKIRQIEEGIESIDLEMLSSNQESAARGWKMVENAGKEVSVLFPSVNVFNAAIHAGIIELYNNAAERGVTVKILIRAAKDAGTLTTGELAQRKLLPSIQVKTFQETERKTSEGIMMAILVVDNREVIAWNLLDMNASDLYQMAGNAIYSSNASVVSSYHSIFNSLWEQVELYRQIRIHEQLQKEFINIAAHELRTPIQPILGTADLFEYILKDKDKIEVTKDQIELIIRNAKRLERLSSDILTISRIESQSLTLNKETVALQHKIKDVISDAKPSIKNNSNLKIDIAADAELITVEADASKLYEVLSNLLRNAIKFTEGGTITVLLRKQKDEQNGKLYALISFKDTGTGIDPEIMPRLFEKFATIGESEGGTGLGLFISKSIVEAHGGKIWAENNKDGKGATFTITLPISSSSK